MHAELTENSLAPVLLCNQCAKQIKGEGRMLYLKGKRQVGVVEIFPVHQECRDLFKIMNRPPKGAEWWSVDAEKYLHLLRQNTALRREKRATA
jgi:hypothetical protein